MWIEAVYAQFAAELPDPVVWLMPRTDQPLLLRHVEEANAMSIENDVRDPGAIGSRA